MFGRLRVESIQVTSKRTLSHERLIDTAVRRRALVWRGSALPARGLWWGILSAVIYLPWGERRIAAARYCSYGTYLCHYAQFAQWSCRIRPGR